MEVLAFSACLDPSIIDYPKVGKNVCGKISRTKSSDHLAEQHDLCTFRVVLLKVTGNTTVYKTGGMRKTQMQGKVLLKSSA